MRRSHRFLRVLLVATVASIVIAAQGRAATGMAAFDRQARPVVSAVAGRIEAPLVQLRPSSDHQPRSDNDGRRIDLGILASAAALLAAGVVSVIRCSRARRSEATYRGGIRARAPPLSLSPLTYSATLL